MAAAATPLIPGISEGGEVAAAGAPPALSAMAAAPPPAPGQGDRDLPVRSSASPSIPPPPPPIPVFNRNASNMLLDEQIPPPPFPIPEHMLHGGVGRVALCRSEGREMGTNGVGRMGGQEDVDGGDPHMGTDGGGGKRQKCTNLAAGKQRKISNSKAQVVDSKIQTEKTKIEHPKQRLKKSSNRKSGSPRSPMPVVSSPGVNIVMSRSTTSGRAMSRSAASFKRVKLESLPKTSQQLPETSQQLPQTPQQSPETSQQSPETQAANVTPSPDPRRTNSHALKRRRRKLISAIWKEAVPIYSGRRLVQGRCIHCQQVFPAARETGTSHIKWHLNVCPAKTEMNEMVDRLGHPEEIDPNWKFNPEVAKRKLVKLIVLNELPFAFVEYTAFRKFTAALNPSFENLSRTTIKNECKIAYNEHATDLKEYFENCDSRISL